MNTEKIKAIDLPLINRSIKRAILGIESFFRGSVHQTVASDPEPTFVHGLTYLNLMVRKVYGPPRQLGSPSDEKVFADPPKPMYVYVTKSVPGDLVSVETSATVKAEATGSAPHDSILAGDLIQMIDEREIIDLSGLTSALAEIRRAAIATIRI